MQGSLRLGFDFANNLGSEFLAGSETQDVAPETMTAS